jgi:hypothetical protein
MSAPTREIHKLQPESLIALDDELTTLRLCVNDAPSSSLRAALHRSKQQLQHRAHQLRLDLRRLSFAPGLLFSLRFDR